MGDQVLAAQDLNVERTSRLPTLGKLPRFGGLRPPTIIPTTNPVKRKLSPDECLVKKQRTTDSSSTSSDDTNNCPSVIAKFPQPKQASKLGQPRPVIQQPAKKQLFKATSHSTLNNVPNSTSSKSSQNYMSATANKFKKPTFESATSRKQPVTAVAIKIRDLENQIRETEEARLLEVEIRNEQTLEYESKLKSIKDQNRSLDARISTMNAENLGLKDSLAAIVASKAVVDAKLLSAKMLIQQHELTIRERNAEIMALKTKIDECKEVLEEAKLKSMKEETMRRQLHNTIQELKGNIRVFSRVRPLLGDELLGMDSDVPQHINFPDPDKKILELEKLASIAPNESVASVRRGSNNKYEFQFDRVFPPASTQEEVFHEISQLVQSALDGYNVCIFAYGQTGSGKTFTMEGKGLNENRGMIPRSVEKIFATIDELMDKGWTYKIEVSFLEIYNETIRDLLSQSKNDSVKHDIKLVGPNTNEVFVTDLTTVEVMDQDEVQSLLKRALDNRSVAETKCNERSSRSHSIFRMRITGVNKVTAESCVGLLNLVDLAGSERLKESGSQGQRLKETQSINKSLACLTNVIMALANKEAHVPYRNSKLTHLLQNCLGGSSKMLMFVNVSPKEECFQETLNSLRFATQVNQCNIGPAQKKTK